MEQARKGRLQIFLENLIALLMIVTLPSLLNAQTLGEKRISHDDIILLQGQPSPYFGVLVDEDAYRYYQKSVERALILENNQPPPCKCDYTKPFLFGVVVLSVGLVLYGHKN